ncbi:MAG: tetratricopeptide repeat protein [Desulfobulbaceae bacterium]
MNDPKQPLSSVAPQGAAPKEDPALTDPAKADYKAGREFLAKGEYGQAAMALHNALLGFEEQGDEQGVANAADRMGDVCMAREEYQMALEHFQRAKAICEKQHDAFSIVALNKKRAVALRRLGELDQALVLLFDIFDHDSQLRNPKGTVEVLEAIAEVYLEKGERQKGADALRTIAVIHKNFKHARLAEEYENRARQMEQE